MAIRTALINGNNLNKDSDFSKIVETFTEWWVIEWLEVWTNQVAVWKARVPCERTWWEVVYALVYNWTNQAISWEWDVYIKVNQSAIDNGELNNEDWTWIATIEVWTLPSKNALLLATISSWVATDERYIIKKNDELSTSIDWLLTRMTTAEQNIIVMQEKSALDHLEAVWIVWEKYSMSDLLYVQRTPTYDNSILWSWQNVWDVNANKQIHIQRITNKVASNQLKLAIKSVWSPTTDVIVEVRAWTKVDVDDTEAYWYWWGDLIASWSIPYSSITNNFQEITVNLNNNIWWTQWQLVDIVVYQYNNIVNSTNYYVLWCDNTQYSQAFRLIKVNWTTRTTSYLMAYCVSDWIADRLLCKSKEDIKEWYTEILMWSWSSRYLGSGATTQTRGATVPANAICHLEWIFQWDTPKAWTYCWFSWDFLWQTWNNASAWWYRYFHWIAWSNWWTISLTANCSVYSWNWWYAHYEWVKFWYATSYLAWWEWEKKAYPRSVEAIWDIWYATIMWYTQDWIRVPEPSQISNWGWSATTWSISLWNAATFLVVQDNTWKSWKIPAYNL